MRVQSWCAVEVIREPGVAAAARDAADAVDVRRLIESESALSTRHRAVKALSAFITK
jgi:hypothetical protein